MPGEVECDDVLNYWNYCSFIRRFRRQLLSGTPCTGGADDRARRLMPHRTPCIESDDDRARRLMPHRTLCSESAHDRARRLMHHRTPCTYGANDRADKRCTPCTPSASSPRARMAPLWEGLSSASCPSSSTLLSASRRHWHRRYPELESSPSDATPSSPSFLRAPQSAVDQKTGSKTSSPGRGRDGRSGRSGLPSPGRGR